MELVPHTNLMHITNRLVTTIQQEVNRSKVGVRNGVVLNFKDPDYSAEKGGYHPVEIAIQSDGRLMYITEFSFVGMRSYLELAKELDFDFEHGVFQQFDREYPIKQTAELFALWQRNFTAYHRMGVYVVTVGELS